MNRNDMTLILILFVSFFAFTICIVADVANIRKELSGVKTELRMTSSRVQELENILADYGDEMVTDVVSEEVEEIEIPEVEEPIEDTDMWSLNNVFQIEPCSVTSTFKSYMDYRTITNQSTKQWAYQQEAVTGMDGIRYYDGRMMVAMAGREVGEEIDVVLDGVTLEVIVGDIKADTNCEHPDGSILEFIVDTNTMDGLTKRLGNYNHVYQGPIKWLRIHKEG